MCLIAHGFLVYKPRVMSSQPLSVSHRQIWQLAAPMIAANISIPLLGMVDTAVMGHLNSAHYLGAVAIGTLIFSFLFWGFGFLRMATTGQTAQATGKHDDALAEQILSQSIKLALLFSAIILALQQPIAHLAFSLIDASETVHILAKNYFAIRIWSAPAILLNYVVLGWLIGLGCTRTAFLLILLVNVSNIILDLVFVYYLNMTIDGVALASVIAEYLGLALSYWIIKRHGLNRSTLLRTQSQKFSRYLQTLKLHGNIFIRTLCLLFSFAFFTTQGAKQGDITLAANAVLLNFITFMAFVLDGFANAVEVISGKAIGRQDQQQLKQGLLYTALWSFVIACLFSTTYFFFGWQLINLLTDLDAVRDTAYEYLMWLVIAPLVGVWSYLFDGLFIGATLSKEMRNTMLFSTFCCYLPAWYLLQPYNNHGLWLALLLFLAARGLSQALYIPSILRIKK